MLILASQSPRRKKLMEDAGYTFLVYPSKVEEVVDESWNPEICVQELSKQKAQWVVKYFDTKKQNISFSDTIIIASDTVVAIENEILGKPKDFDDAYDMLWRLSRARHRVLTGICLTNFSGKRLVDYDTTYVTMRPMSEKEITDYVNSGESMGKAGAYAIQESADRFVEKLEGSFDNVVGLPMKKLEDMLKRF